MANNNIILEEILKQYKEAASIAQLMMIKILNILQQNNY